MSSTSWTNLLDLIYPVGSIYQSVSSSSPASLFGGTWAQKKDVFLLGAGKKASGSTGGSETVTLELSQIPRHFHTNSQGNGVACWSIEVAPVGSGWYAATNNLGEGQGAWIENRSPERGGGEAHDNMPPYLCVYIWQRTA